MQKYLHQNPLVNDFCYAYKLLIEIMRHKDITNEKINEEYFKKQTKIN